MLDALDELIASIGTEDSTAPPIGAEASIALPACPILAPARRKKRATPEHEKTSRWKTLRALNTERARKSRKRARARELVERAQREHMLADLQRRNMQLKAQVASLEVYLEQLMLRKFVFEL